MNSSSISARLELPLLDAGLQPSSYSVWYRTVVVRGIFLTRCRFDDQPELTPETSRSLGANARIDRVLVRSEF